MSDRDARQVLASRLRALREEQWPGKKVNQAQLAAALGSNENRSVSVPLISSWESRTAPAVPPESRIRDIATFFASPRSFDGQAGRLLSPSEMTAEERSNRERLFQELSLLRNEARAQPAVVQPPVPVSGPAADIAQSLRKGLYRFREGQIITIVCAPLPDEMLEGMPYTDPADPDFTQLYTYSDPDALVELFGHLRATNPGNRVEFRSASQLAADDYTAHLILLGGVDWNVATTSVLDRLGLPVTQVSRAKDEPGSAYFEVPGEDGRSVIHRPTLDPVGERLILREDVALFARAKSPFNRKRTVTICNGMYGRGTYGAVRALTDERFRDRNMEYIDDRFGGNETFCILTKVTVENGVTLTPDWTLPETRLYEWSRSQ